MVQEKVKVGNCPKSGVKILRTIVGRKGWRRRHESGAFDTEIFRRSRAALSVRPENGRKVENVKSEKYCGARKSEGWKLPGQVGGEKLGKKFAYHCWEKVVGETARKLDVRY